MIQPEGVLGARVFMKTILQKELLQNTEAAGPNSVASPIFSWAELYNYPSTCWIYQRSAAVCSRLADNRINSIARNL